MLIGALRHTSSACHSRRRGGGAGGMSVGSGGGGGRPEPELSQSTSWRNPTGERWRGRLRLAIPCEAALGLKCLLALMTPPPSRRLTHIQTPALWSPLPLAQPTLAPAVFLSQQRAAAGGRSFLQELVRFGRPRGQQQQQCHAHDSDDLVVDDLVAHTAGLAAALAPPDPSHHHPDRAGWRLMVGGH